MLRPHSEQGQSCPTFTAAWRADTGRQPWGPCMISGHRTQLLTRGKDPRAFVQKPLPLSVTTAQATSSQSQHRQRNPQSQDLLSQIKRQTWCGRNHGRNPDSWGSHARGLPQRITAPHRPSERNQELRLGAQEPKEEKENSQAPVAPEAHAGQDPWRPLRWGQGPAGCPETGHGTPGATVYKVNGSCMSWQMDVSPGRIIKISKTGQAWS